MRGSRSQALVDQSKLPDSQNWARSSEWLLTAAFDVRKTIISEIYTVRFYVPSENQKGNGENVERKSLNFAVSKERTRERNKNKKKQPACDHSYDHINH